MFFLIDPIAEIPLCLTTRTVECDKYLFCNTKMHNLCSRVNTFFIDKVNRLEDDYRIADLVQITPSHILCLTA
jgi:hypothetical protein